ncbi:hypothetical protein D3C71_2045470 [compost metagenome]
MKAVVGLDRQGRPLPYGETCNGGHSRSLWGGRRKSCSARYPQKDLPAQSARQDRGPADDGNCADRVHRMYDLDNLLLVHQLQAPADRQVHWV